MEDPDVLSLQIMLNEISQSKGPIGKQQIVDISKAAMTAIHHFKHVVHAIEKFILKCKSHHKLAGFYMIDSIVRQGQKKFKHKDVFGPRFAVNLRQTLVNALTCPTKERPKVVRQLNLWKANSVFSDEILLPLLQHCRASGLDVDVEKVEIAVKGSKADMSRYGANDLSISPIKVVTSSSSHSITASNNNDSFILKLLSSVNPDYDKVFSTNSRAFQKVMDLLTDNIKKSLSSSSKNKLQNILSEGFDYSDEDEYSGDENKTSVDINSISKDQLDKTTESLMKKSNILSEIRNIYIQNGGTELHGSSSRHDERDRKRRRSRSPSRERRDSDRKREKNRRSKERSYRRRTSTPPRHREDKREKERRKLGFPQESKSEHCIIGSRTIWLGRLPANCSEVEIKNALTDIGTPEKIQIINSRACAYITMPDRRSAYKIIDRMSNKLEVSRRLVKVSWATGNGLKSDAQLNVFWDSQNGYHEIPWASLPSKIDQLFEGGYADIATFPPKFKDMFDEKGKLLKTKTPELPQQNLSHVPLPPLPKEIPPMNLPPPNMPPSVVPPPMTNIPPRMLPQGLNLPPPTMDNKDPSLEMLIAAVANGNNSQPGILGVAPQLNPAILNTLNALNVRQQLANVNRAHRNEISLPDQQAAFQHFRGNAPRPLRNDFNHRGGFNPCHPFSPRNRGGFNNGNRFTIPDMNNSLPNMTEQPPPMHFNVPPPRLPNFSQPPPSLNTVQPQQQQDEPMDIASPDGPPGV